MPDLVAHIARAGSDTGWFGRRIPILAIAKANGTSSFDRQGMPSGPGWDEVEFPDVGDPDIFALEVADDDMAPAIRRGDVVVVSPKAGVRHGDRVVAGTADGLILTRELVRRTANRVELCGAGAASANTELNAAQVTWLSRIIWIWTP